MGLARSFSIGALLGAWAAGPCAWAHGDGTNSRSASAARTQTPWGIEGNPTAAARTVETRMTDDMRFAPDRIEVRQGDTVRFVVRNEGTMLHGKVIGTREALAEHAALMKKFPGMEHGEAYMIHVKPGGTGEIRWNFNRRGDFQFACLVAGHYQAGLVGAIRVKAVDTGNNKK